MVHFILLHSNLLKHYSISIRIKSELNPCTGDPRYITLWVHWVWAFANFIPRSTIASTSQWYLHSWVCSYYSLYYSAERNKSAQAALFPAFIGS
nr:hypothetical protein Q903MT_gene6580 [Picea sitchensis]